MLGTTARESPALYFSTIDRIIERELGRSTMSRKFYYTVAYLAGIWAGVPLDLGYEFSVNNLLCHYVVAQRTNG